MSRKTSKEYREEKARRDTDPPYLFTCICPDPDRRESKYAPMLRIHKSMKR